MSDRSSGPDRRDFIRTTLAAGAGAAVVGARPERLTARARKPFEGPLVITSHSNQTGQNAMSEAWDMLSGGGSALDAVERAANVIEVDPDDMSVGYGGLPNQDGVVALDACIMDGRTYNAGSVAAIEKIKTPSSVARLVMERTDHVMIVGEHALDFAKSFGFQEEELLTERARRVWLRWRESHGPDDDWGPPDHLRGLDEEGGGGMELPEGAIEHTYGTTNVLAVDANGDIAGITTTSGLSWKIPGRIGDSPIIGAGLYVDNDVGAAGATGRGEDVIKSCASYYIVLRMRDGRSPQEACEDAIELIIDKYRNVNPDFVPGEKFVAINKDGEYGCARMGGRAGSRPRISLARAGGVDVYEGSSLHTRG